MTAKKGLVLGTITLLLTLSAQALGRTACVVKPSPNVSVKTVELSAINQRQTHVAFKIDDETVEEICDITEQEKNLMVVVCYANHGSITLRINGGKSKISLEATARSGDTFEAATIMSCSNKVRD